MKFFTVFSVSENIPARFLPENFRGKLLKHLNTLSCGKLFSPKIIYLGLFQILQAYYDVFLWSVKTFLKKNPLKKCLNFDCLSCGKLFFRRALFLFPA